MWNMNRQEFENALTVLPQDFFFFEENFGRWESFKKMTQLIVCRSKPDASPICKVDLQIAIQQIMSLTSSFREGKTIAKAIAICKKQLNFEVPPEDDFDYSGESSTEESDTSIVVEYLPALSPPVPEQASKKLVKLKPNQNIHDLTVFQPDWICAECHAAETISETKKAIEFLCNRVGGGGWVLTFVPTQV